MPRPYDSGNAGRGAVLEVALCAGPEAAAGLVRREPIRVGLDVVLPLLRHVILEEDRVYGADRLAGGAVDADLGIDVVLLVLAGAVDAVHRADVHAGGILRADAGLRDYVSHLRFQTAPAWLVLHSLAISRSSVTTSFRG